MGMTPGIKQKVLWLSADLLVRLFGLSERECIRVTDHALPADTRVVRLVVDPDRGNRVGLVIQSDSFERAPMHLPLPEITHPSILLDL